MDPQVRFTPEELDRYARHLVLREVGGAGQQRFKAARVLIIGAGGLGSPVALYLAAAGIGTIGIVDDDAVALSNLQRQIIHSTDDVGRPKVASAAAAVRRLNPHVHVEAHQFRITPESGPALVGAYDLVVDGSDNFSTRFLVADLASEHRRPLVTGAVGRFDGSVTVLKPYEGNNPSYRDLFGSEPPPSMVPGCEEVGILGAVTGVIGSLQALEVLKLVAGIGEPLVGRLLLYDALAQRFDEIRYARADSGS